MTDQATATIMGKIPLDRSVKAVADFLYTHLDTPDLEIEAKFGIIIDSETGVRLHLPLATDAVLIPEINEVIRFESDMSLDMHKRFNQLLNDRVTATKGGVKYKHTRELDESYYSVELEGRIRVSKDVATGNVLRVVAKRKVADLHIYIPYSALDCRISINVEQQVDPPAANDRLLSTRNKDRLSYLQEELQFDLTQVKTNDDRVSHELELEIANLDKLRAERAKITRGEPNKYVDLVSKFVNNIRSVAAKVALR